MAVRHIEQLVCDYCGNVKEADDFHRNVTFSLFGKKRELDLCTGCMSVVEGIMAPIFAVSRPTTSEVTRRVVGHTGRPNVNKGRHYPEIECAICHKMCRGNQGIANHMVQTHGPLAGPQTCDECGKSFGGIMGLRGHMARVGHKSHQGEVGTPLPKHDTIIQLPSPEMESAQA